MAVNYSKLPRNFNYKSRVKTTKVIYPCTFITLAPGLHPNKAYSGVIYADITVTFVKIMRVYATLKKKSYPNDPDNLDNDKIKII